MNSQTLETFKELRDALRYGAKKRLELNPHDSTAHILCAIVIELDIAIAMRRQPNDP